MYARLSVQNHLTSTDQPWTETKLAPNKISIIIKNQNFTGKKTTKESGNIVFMDQKIVAYPQAQNLDKDRVKELVVNVEATKFCKKHIYLKKSIV